MSMAFMCFEVLFSGRGRLYGRQVLEISAAIGEIRRFKCQLIGSTDVGTHHLYIGLFVESVADVNLVGLPGVMFGVQKKDIIGLGPLKTLRLLWQAFCANCASASLSAGFTLF